MPRLIERDDRSILGHAGRPLEGVKVRETNNLNSYYHLPLAFDLCPFAYLQLTDIR